ncbi:hypothetical protein N8I77_008557 [Diaporthe amygdali]|uniref:Cell cycle control protein n=1 Tax=Phomopsis amygdali TaxID=1214568 RepID=A0AAD9SDX9_PHOAM|nr:hypothetical protein N8I77_008557 [Diaporthe amygdali]KAK2605742.1 hypothetical protein N8I77_008557 [Diaporthe amygdali]
MNRFRPAHDLVDPEPYLAVLPADYYFLQQVDGGVDGGHEHEHELELLELDFEDQDPDLLPLGSPQSPSVGSVSSVPSASGDGDDINLAISDDDNNDDDDDGHLDLDSDLDSDLEYDQDYNYDHDHDHDHDSPPQQPLIASPRSPSLSVPLSLSPSPSASPDSLLLNDSDSDSAADLDADLDADPRLRGSPLVVSDSTAASASPSDSDPDSDQDQDPDPVGLGLGPGSGPSSSPNPDPLRDRPRHHLQANSINHNLGLYGSPPRLPRPPRPARASQTPDIHPNRRLPGPPPTLNQNNHQHQHQHQHQHRHHHHHSHHHGRAFDYDSDSDNSASSPRPTRHPDRSSNRSHPPPALPLGNYHFGGNRPDLDYQPRPHPRPQPSPVSQPRHPSRNSHHAELASHERQPQRPHRQHPQQSALVEVQDLEDQHEDDDLDIGDYDHQDDLSLLDHLRLRRARRAARAAREAGRQRPGRGNWRPHRPARRAVAEQEPEDSGQEDSDYTGSMDQDDELIEVVYQGRAPAPPTPTRRQHQQQRHLRAHRQQRQQNHEHNHNNFQGQELMELDQELDLGLGLDQQVPVIDLTEEPDSPVLQRHRPVNILRHNHGQNHGHNHIHISDDEEDDDDSPLYQAPRNPRRHMSQNGRMPSLNRSDGSILNGNAAAVIDLTLDSPDDNIPADRRLPPPPAALVAQLNQRANRNRRLPGPAAASPAPAAAAPPRVQYQDFGRHLIGSIRGLLPGLLAQAVNNPREADVQFVGAVPVPAFPMNPNPLAGNPPEFNYQANGFGGYGGRQPTPKPDFQAPPAPRAGFTRDTRAESGDDEDLVVVCPSCDNELKYSPDDEDDNPRPAKKPRGKKGQEEHHFWAVKNCGHVYCKSCYDNRKKHSKGKESAAAKTGFRFQPSETSKSIKIFCAVEDCESEVSPNNAWVGIFM